MPLGVIFDADPVVDTPPDALLGVLAILVLGTLLSIAATWWDARRRRPRR